MRLFLFVLILLALTCYVSSRKKKSSEGSKKEGASAKERQKTDQKLKKKKKAKGGKKHRKTLNSDEKKKKRKEKRKSKKEKKSKKERNPKNGEKEPDPLPCRSLHTKLADCVSNKNYRLQHCALPVANNFDNFVPKNDELTCSQYEFQFMENCECFVVHLPAPPVFEPPLTPPLPPLLLIPPPPPGPDTPDCYSGVGEDYSGSVSVTESGKTCLHWRDNYPQEHSFSELLEEGNFCRNVDGKERPYCYTTENEWEYCHLPPCLPPIPTPVYSSKEDAQGNDIEYNTGDEATDPPDFLFSDGFVDRIVPPGPERDVENLHCYSGKGDTYWGTVNATKGGLPCQRWSSQTPHPHYYRYLGDHNYCRNPNNKRRPWCYIDTPTSDGKTWDVCPVPKCVERDNLTQQRKNGGLAYRGGDIILQSGGACDEKIQKNITLHNCLVGTGSSYAGTVNITSNGSTCLPWTSVVNDGLHYSELYSADVQNFCRNPDQSARPWCFVGEGEREFCNVHKCTPDTQRSQVEMRANVCSRYVHDAMSAPWCYVVEGGQMETCTIKM